MNNPTSVVTEADLNLTAAALVLRFEVYKVARLINERVDCFATARAVAHSAMMLSIMAQHGSEIQTRANRLFCDLRADHFSREDAGNMRDEADALLDAACYGMNSVKTAVDVWIAQKRSDFWRFAEEIGDPKTREFVSLLANTPELRPALIDAVRFAVTLPQNVANHYLAVVFSRAKFVGYLWQAGYKTDETWMIDFDWLIKYVKSMSDYPRE